MNLVQLFESDMSGVMHAARHHNKSFIITANVDGAKKKFRVNHQTADLAKDKFLQHHSMAKILDVQQDGVTEVRDRRDAYQRDYDSSVSGMGNRQSRAYRQDGGGNDERHDLDPSDWYFVKDGKMFAVSVYPNQEQQAISLGYSRTRAEAKTKAGQQGVAEGSLEVAEASKQKLMIGSKVTHPDHGKGTVVMHATGGGTTGTVVKFANGKKVKVDHKKLTIVEQGVAEDQLNELSPKTLQSYEKKAVKSMNKNLSQWVKRGDWDALERGDRRATGIAKAGNKLDAIEKKGVAEGRATYGPITDAHKAAAKKAFAAGERDGKAGAEKNKQYMSSALMKTTYLNGYKQGKQGVAEGFNAEYNDEAGMADNNLETLKRAVQGLDNIITAGDNLPEWCQEKIAVSKSMLVSVWDYMLSEKEKN